MNVPTTIEAVIIVVLILLPGYVCSVVLGRAIAFISDSVDFRYLLRILAIGMALHAILFPLWTRRIVEQYLDETLALDGFEVWSWAVTAVLVVPIVAGLGVGWLAPKSWMDRQLDKIGLGWIDRLPSAWDYASRLGPAWVKVYLTDGIVIGGKFADKSVASINQANRDLYIEQLYTLDEHGNLTEPVPDTMGVWISSAAITRVEFLQEFTGDIEGVRHGDNRARNETAEPDEGEA